jgi:hypothetical protein
MLMPLFKAVEDSQALSVTLFPPCNCLCLMCNYQYNATINLPHIFKEVAAKNRIMAANAISLMKAIASEAEVHRRQRALAEVNQLFTLYKNKG